MIVLPDLLWDVLMQEFVWPRRKVERVGYIDGIDVSPGMSIATTLTFPAADLHPTYFEVSSEAMSQAGQHFREFGMVRLAQVHTHPGRDVRHSSWDDKMAYAQHDGAVSIVVPYHAAHRPELRECGVQIRQTIGWIRLKETRISDYIRIVPGFLDYRTF